MTSGFLRKVCLDMGHHPLIAELFETLPPVDQAFSVSKREKWLAVAKAVFDLIYLEPQHKARVELTRPEPVAELPAPPSNYGTHILPQPQQHALEALHHMRKEPDGWVVEPARAIAQKAGLSNTGINAVLEALERKKHIKIDRRRGEGFNRYMILDQAKVAA